MHLNQEKSCGESCQLLNGTVLAYLRHPTVSSIMMGRVVALQNLMMFSGSLHS